MHQAVAKALDNFNRELIHHHHHRSEQQQQQQSPGTADTKSRKQQQGVEQEPDALQLLSYEELTVSEHGTALQQLYFIANENHVPCQSGTHGGLQKASQPWDH